MENSVLERINKVIYNNGCSITFLSKELGIVQTTLNRQIKGKCCTPRDGWLKKKE